MDDDKTIRLEVIRSQVKATIERAKQTQSEAMFTQQRAQDTRERARLVKESLGNHPDHTA